MKFEAIDKFYSTNKDFCKSFFKGRITERDRDDAEIELNFNISKYHFQLVRGLFEPEELRFLKVTDSESNQIEFDSSKEDFSSQEVHDKYRDLIIQQIGLESFSQLVFLQHFIFTFMESSRRDSLAKLEMELKDENLKLAEANSKIGNLTLEYEEVFNARLKSQYPI